MDTVIDPPAVQYSMKCDEFKQLLEAQERSCVLNGNVVRQERGRKFDKIYILTPSGQKLGRYMVDRNSWDIYGVKSWGQVNPRRWFGTLNTVDQYDWSPYAGRPLAGTDAATAHLQREQQITATFKKRGRPRKTI